MTKVRRPAGSGPAPELKGLDGLASDILGRLDLEASLLAVVNAAVDLIDTDIAGILLLDEGDDEVLTMRACTGHRSVGTAHLKAGPGQGVAEKVLATRKPFKVDDYTTSRSISHDFYVIAEEEGTRSALGAPMMVGGQVIGTLMAWARRPSKFSAGDLQTLASLASLATIAIVNARLYETERAAVSRLKEANRRLEDQYGLLRRSSRIHGELTRLVLDGEGLTELVATVVEHTGGGVAAMDVTLELLTASEESQALVDRAVRHLRWAAGRSGSDPRTVTIVPPDHFFERWLLVAESAAGGATLGHVVIGLDHSPTSLDEAIIEQAAIVCALVLTKETAVLEASGKAHSDFVWELVEGEIDDEGEATRRARHLGYELPERLRLILIEVENLDAWAEAEAGAPEAAERRKDALAGSARRLAQAGATTPVPAARRGSLIALVVRGDEDSAPVRSLAGAILHSLEEAHSGLRLTAGISGPFGFAAGTTPALVQAQNALCAASAAGSGDRVGAFDDLGVLQFLLAPGNRGDLRGFVQKVLGPILDYDRDHSADLVRTAEVYLDCDCNLQRTAARLYIHPKTVRYRLDRVVELGELDMSCQRDRFNAQLAITTLRALSLQDTRK